MYHIIKHHVPRLGTMQSRGLSPEATHGKTRSNSRRMLATTLGASVLRVSRCLNVAASASSILCLSTPAGHLEAATKNTNQAVFFRLSCRKTYAKGSCCVSTILLLLCFFLACRTFRAVDHKLLPFLHTPLSLFPCTRSKRR